MLDVGDSFTFTNKFGKHLHVVVAESSPDDSAEIMLVYISSTKNRHRDGTTIIQEGEHPYIDRKSWVRYQSVLVHQRNIVEANIVEQFGKVDEQLLERIQKGVLDSDRVSERTKKLFHEWKMDKAYRAIKN